MRWRNPRDNVVHELITDLRDALLNETIRSLFCGAGVIVISGFVVASDGKCVGPYVTTHEPTTCIGCLLSAIKSDRYRHWYGHP